MALTNGRPVSPRFPNILAHVQIRQWDAEVEALLDTGFNGDVAIPADVLPDVGPPDGHSRWTLADGSPVFAPYFVGTVHLIGLGPFTAVFIVLGDELSLEREERRTSRLFWITASASSFSRSRDLGEALSMCMPSQSFRGAVTLTASVGVVAYQDGPVGTQPRSSSIPSTAASPSA